MLLMLRLILLLLLLRPLLQSLPLLLLQPLLWLLAIAAAPAAAAVGAVAAGSRALDVVLRVLEGEFVPLAYRIHRKSIHLGCLPSVHLAVFTRQQPVL